ncbi:MAG: CopG family transcriptional regulator [Actinomycetota bacterium]|nr:CopG family transcriptional regulator [Actinomycetota bacterium]
MDLNPYIQQLQDDLAIAAGAGGEEARALAGRLTAPLDAAMRLALLDALSFAAAEITRELAPGSVELRLRGRDAEFVVTAADPDPPQQAAEPSTWVPGDGDDATLTRINLRLAQDLKDRVEEAAHQSGLSVNAWLVRSAAAALSAPAAWPLPKVPGPRGGAHFTGWVR